MRRSLLLLAMALTSAQASAQDPVQPEEPAEDPETKRYRELIRDAIAEYDAGRYEESLAMFEQAYALKPTPRVLRGMAKAQFELRRYALSMTTIDRALGTQDDPLTDEMRDELAKLRERALRYVGKVAVRVSPKNAEVLLDGRPLALAERSGIVVDVGKHVVEAQARNYQDARRSVEVRGGGGTTTLAIDLVPLPAPRTQLVVQKPADEPDRVPVYVTAGVALLGIGGVVASAIWFADRDAATDTCTEAALAGAQCENADSIATQRDASIWLLAGSIAVTVAGGIAFGILLGQSTTTVACSGLTCTATLRF
ncbi:MAG TPA: PEGA domain-containing protein [Polyangiaceae bacterium]|nr:PEGA domain-containing protein [Polyangiaceae bacterium]